MSSIPLRLAKFLGLTCFLLTLMTLPAFAQESAEACGNLFDDATGANPTPTYPKYCQGKYVTAQGTETIITVGCPNLTDSCTCGADGVHCGGNHTVTGNMTLVSGSCKERWLQDPEEIDPNS